jgi:hypothetical protein
VHQRIRLYKRTRLAHWALLLFLLISAALCAQQAAEPQPVAIAPILTRLEGVDAGSGIHYVRLLLTLPSSGDEQMPTPAPRFTMECRDNKGKRDLLWFVSFGGADDSGFLPPFHPTRADIYPPRYPNAKLTMIFEGYIKWKPITKEWEVLPSGELRYRNPGMGSPNMEPARSFLQYLNSLPGLRIGYAKPQKGDPAAVFFQTQPLLDEIKRTPACQP